MARHRLSDLITDIDAPIPVKPVWGLSDIFEEEPVSLTVFVKDKGFLANPPLSPVQYEAVRHIERIYLADTYKLMGAEWAYWADPVRMTNFITLQFGKGSGKDHVCRIASMRIAYLLQCLISPQEYFGLPPQDTIHMLNVASSSSQANQAFFIPMTRAVARGWFQDKCHPKPGVGLISWKKNVEMVSGHADAESQEGLNLILGVADEIDAFRSREDFMRTNNGKEPQKSIEAILKMLRGSAVTRFPETFKNVRISYPRFLGSPIQKLTAQARLDNDTYGEASRHYVAGPLVTWAVNPRYDQFEKITIPESVHPIPNVASIIEDYKEDADMARSMYECLPSRAVDTYFRNPEAIRNCFTTATMPLTFDYVIKAVTSQITGTTSHIWEPIFEFGPGLVARSGVNYAIHADLAIKGDRAGIAMSHVARYISTEQVQMDEDGLETVQEVLLPVVTTDFVVALEANLQLSPAREIQISWVRKLVFELVRKGFNIVSVSYDGFQSVDSMQIFTSHGMETKKISTDLDESIWKNFRDVAYEGRWSCPYSELLITELESLGRFGGRVDHPPNSNGSKDLADAVVCSIVRALQFGGEEGDDTLDSGWDFHMGTEQSHLVLGYEHLADPLGYAPEFGFDVPYSVISQN